MNIVKISKLAATFAIALSLATPVLATNLGQEIRKDIKEDIKENRQEKMASRPGFLARVFNLQNKVFIKVGTVTAKNGSTLTVAKDSTTYTVTTDANTQFRRKFWGKSALDEINVGHTVVVIGHWTDDAHTTVLANHVRDLSIQKRFGVFFGEVKSLLSNGWVMSTVGTKRPDQTVTVSSSTKFTNRKEETITQADVQVGAKVRVRGLWDSSANTVTEVTKVKDFGLPIKLTPTVTP